MHDAIRPVQDPTPGVEITRKAVGAIPGNAAPEIASPVTPDPTCEDARRLRAALAGNPIEAAMLLEARDLAEQQKATRTHRLATRERALAEARAAHRHRVAEAGQRRTSAAQGAVVSGGCLAAGARLEICGDTSEGWGAAEKRVWDGLPGVVDGIDRALGHAALADRQGVAAERHSFVGEHLSKNESDAADREQALREAHAKVLDLLQEAMRGRTEAGAAATRA